MGKQAPPGHITWPFHVPQELHDKVCNVAGRGRVNDLYMECVEESMKPRYTRWLKDQLRAEEAKSKEYAKKRENGQRKVRRNPKADAGDIPTENIGDKGGTKTKKQRKA